MIAKNVGIPRSERSGPEWATKSVHDDRRLQMRRSLSIIAAAAIAVGASAASLSSTQAAMAVPTPVTTSGAIVEVGGPGGNWETFHGDRHNAFRDDGWNNGWRHHRRHRHHSNFRRRHFYFGFPFAFRPHFYPYNSYRDCFRTWDGQLICRGY
jgi:hypothetical protein